MSGHDLASIRRRFVLLLVLRWMPSGLFVATFVLLMTQRGLSLGDIGLATAAQGVVMLVLELPSGGLADAVGRKPVLLVAGVVSIAAMVLLLSVDTVLALAVVSTLQGVYRALDSGPLQAWFIDAAIAADPDADIEQCLAVESVVICLSIGAGSLLAGGLMWLGDVGGVDRFTIPIVVAIGIQVTSLVAVAVLLDDPRAARGWTAARSSFVAVPNVVRGAVVVIRRSRLLTALLVAELAWGFGMIAYETLLTPRLVDVSGSLASTSRIIGPTVSAAWGLAALGAAAAPRLVRRFGAGPTGFGLRIAQGVTVAAMALAGGVVGVVVAYWATYSVHSATGPVHYGMVHRGVDAAHRATVVSANSLTSQVGGAISGIVLGVVADRSGVTAAMLIAAVAMAAAAPLYLVGRRADVEPVGMLLNDRSEPRLRAEPMKGTSRADRSRHPVGSGREVERRDDRARSAQGG